MACDVWLHQLRKGLQYVNQWMSEHCCLVQVDEASTLQNVIPSLLKFKEQFRGKVGKESFGFVRKLLYFCTRFAC